MNQERIRILDLLAAGKITAEEAARLLDALEPRPATPKPDENTAKAASTGLPKFMYVKVVSVKGDNVNVKIPLSLVRAGLKLTSLIPPQAMDQINKSMAEHGMSMDLSNLKGEDVEDLLAALREMEINVDAKSGDNIRVYSA
ncbi:MAG TPA: hypothetical protein VIL51_03560 [Thermoleophilia bacterium]